MAINNNRYVTVTITDDDKDEFDEEKIRRNDALQYQKYVEANKKYNLAQNSLSERAASELIKNEAAQKNSFSNDMSYEEKYAYLKEQKKQARNEKIKTAARTALDSIAGQITVNPEKENAAQKQYDAAYDNYEEKKQALQTLKEEKWNEKQKNNSKALSEDMALADLVKKAYEAKIQYNSSQETMDALPSYNNMNSAVNGLPSLADYKNVGSTTNEYEKAIKAVTEKGYTAEEAESLIDTYSRQINAEAQEKRTEKTENFANEHPVLASGAYVASNIGQLAGTKEVIQNGIQNSVSNLFGTGEYKPLDTNTYGFVATNFRDTISETVSDNIRNDVSSKTDNQLAANAATFLYQTGLSIGDFASLAGLGQPASLTIMGTSAAMSTAKDATERGASADKAMLSALWAGASEIVFEKLSLENLDALKASGRSGAKDIIKDILKQSFTEGSEEVFTDISNAIGDQIINSDKSELSQRYEELISDGLSESEAHKQLAIEFAKQIGESYLGGALSGSVMGAGGVAYGNIQADSNYRSVGNELKKSGNAQAEINAGLAQDNTSKAYQAAVQLQSKLDNSISYDNDMKPIDYSSLSSRKLGRLAEYNAQEDARQLEKSAEVFEGDTAKSYVYAYGDNGYKGNVYDYNKGFNAVYMAQQQGKSINEAYDIALDEGSHITPIQATIAYDAAKNDTAVAEFKDALSSPIKIGATVVAKSVDKEQQSTISFINEMAKTAGVEVVIPARMQDVGLKDANGAYVNGKIVLPLDNQGRMMNVYLGHEMFHHFKKNVPDNANVLQNYVIEKLKADGSYKYNERLEKIINDYGFEGTREQQVAAAHEEMAANACFTVFSDEANVKQLVAQDRTLAQKVRDFFAGLINRMKKAIAVISNNAEYRAFSDEESMQEIVDLFDNCLKESQKNNTINNDSVPSTGIKFAKKINDYPYNMQTVIKDYLNSVDDDILQFYNNAINKVPQNPKINIGKVTSQISNEISEVLGVDTEGWNIQFEDRIAKHINKDHGEKGITDKSMADSNDVARMKYVIENHDYYGSAESTEAYKIFENGRNKKAPTITFAKKINGTYYLVMAVPKKKTLWIVTAFMNKKIEAAQFRNASNEPLRHTSKNATASTSTDNVPQSETSVNSNDMQDKGKYSLKENSEGNPLSDEQIKRYKNIAPELRDEKGRIKPFYHGTSRADRVGNYFNPDRATSGPMAYFTDNEKIADNYSKNKSDTSLAYDDEYDSYETQFRVDDKSITEYWYTLSPGEKRELTQKIQQVTLDDDDNIVLKSDNKYGIGNFNDYELNMARGNALQVLVDGWLNGGTLWGDEYRFIDVLNAIGIKNAEYKNPDYREEKVYKVYLNITNPFNTDNVDEEFISDLEDYVGATDMSVYDAENAQADMWDKNSIDIYDWIERLKDDFANGTTHAWTSIPDVVTDFLKEYGGYNGIIDRGGKQGGEIHTVAIPFYSNQIKNVDNINPTDNEDIRYSKKESINVDEFDESGYDIINTTGKKGYAHFKSEVMTWDSDKYLDKIRLARIDDKFYIYKMVSNDSRDIWIYKPKSQQSKNQIKEMREYYAARNYKGSIDAVEIVRNKRRYSNGNNELFRGQREKSRNNDKLNNNQVRGEGNSNRRGITQDDSDDYLQERQYSIKENPIDYNAVIEENAELSEMNEDLKEMLRLTSAQNEKLKNEFKITDRHNISNNAVDKVAAALRKQYSSSYDKTSLVSRLAAMYDYMANAGKDIDSAYIWLRANDIAKNIIANSQQRDTVVYDEYKELRNRIRNTAIRVPQAVQDNFADYNAFRRENFGRLRLSKEGIELDAFYNELSAQYPEFFDVDVSEEQQLEALANFFEVTSPVYYSASEQNAESMGMSMEQYANLIAGDIIDKYFDVPEVMTAAEKHKKEMDTLKLHYRNQIDDMRQSYKYRYDERLREVRAENAKRVTKLRADKADALAKQKAHFEDVSQRGKDRRKASDIKRKIRNIKKQLDSKLLNPTETSYVPQYLVKEIASVCDMITEADKYWKNGNSKAESTVLKLDALHRQYENLAKDGNYDFATEFDSNIAENISTLADALNGKQISELSLAELEDVYNVLKDVKNSLVDATKQIGREEKISNYEARERIVNETMATKGMQSTVIGKYEYWTMNSMRFVRKVTEYNEDAELYKQFLELEKGQRKADKVFMELSKPFVELRNEGKIEFRKSKKTREIVNDWTKFISDKKETPFIDIQGKAVLMSESQLAQLYLTAKREDGINHLTKGSFTVYDAELLRQGKKVAAEQNAQQVSSVTYEDIINVYDSLSDYAKKWINAADYMFNQQSSKAINDVSMVLKHRKLATTKNYIPLAVNQYERLSEIESIKYDRTLEGAGALKSVNKNAGQGLIIEGLHNVVDSHIDFVSQYAGLAIPIRNFNKVYGGVLSDNYSNTLHTYEVRGKKKEDNYKVLSVKSVRQALDSKWSTSKAHLATDIIDKNIRDLQSPRRSDRIKSMGKLQSAWVQATLSANISVTLKQAASYPTAAAVINGKYLDKAMRDKYAWSHFSDLCEEIDEHTGIHYKRRLGMSIQEIAEITKNQEALINKVPAIINPMKWIQAMDCRTTATLWIAAKYQIESKYSDLQKGSNEYWQKVTELYEECIEKTQPNYDVLHRAEIQKVPDSTKNIFAMFQTQPLQNTGLLYDSLFNLQAKSRAYKADNTAENKAARDNAIKNFLNVCQSQMVAAAVFSAMTLFATALKGKMNRYRDDEDGDVTLASIIRGFFGDVGSTIFNTLLPLAGSSIYEFSNNIVKGKIDSIKNGEEFKVQKAFDLFSYPLVSTLNDTVQSFYGIVEIANKVINNTATPVMIIDSTRKFAEQVCSLCGKPFANFNNTIEGLVYWIMDLKNGDFGEFEAAADRTTTQKLNAVINEDGTDETKMYDKYADLVYSSSKGSDLLYYYLREYGYNSSRYNKEEEAYCDAKIKFTTTENPDPLTSMKSKALDDYIGAKDNKRDDVGELRSLCLKLYGSESKLNKALEAKQNNSDKKKQKALENYAYYKENGPYDEYEKARQKCIQLYGDMTKVNEALEKLND